MGALVSDLRPVYLMKARLQLRGVVQKVMTPVGGDELFSHRAETDILEIDIRDNGPVLETGDESD